MILIADSGSTKTEWRLIDQTSQVQAIRTDGLNPYYQDTPTITKTLSEQLVSALHGAVVHEVFFYGAGCANAETCATVANALQAVLPQAIAIDVQSDMLGAARAACGHEPGVACILGTGSNAALYNGQTISSPGYSLGFWLGDEGSGGHLGKQVVLAYLHQQLPPDLAEAFAQAYPLDRLTVLDNAYHQPFPNRYFARFAPFLSQHSQHPFVQNLVSQSLSNFLRLYVSRVAPGNMPVVNFVGSVAFYFQDILRRVGQEQGYLIGQILPAPINALVEYHR